MAVHPLHQAAISTSFWSQKFGGDYVLFRHIEVTKSPYASLHISLLNSRYKSPKNNH